MIIIISTITYGSTYYKMGVSSNYDGHFFQFSSVQFSVFKQYGNPDVNRDNEIFTWVDNVDLRRPAPTMGNCVCTLREINSHHNYNTSTFFFSNENLIFLVLKTYSLIGTAF